MDLSRIPRQLDRKARTVRAVVETPRGGRSKFAYRPEIEAFEFSHLVPEGMAFPLDFGFVPSTRGEDGDPIDIMILADEPLPTGAVVTARLIGVIEGKQTEDGLTVRNDRLIGVADKSILFAKVTRLHDLEPEFETHLTSFWTTYNRLRGREFQVLAVKTAAAAVALILDRATT